MHGRSADDVDARQWREMDGEENLVGMSERGCADVRGRRGLPGSPYNPFKKLTTPFFLGASEVLFELC